MVFQFGPCILLTIKYLIELPSRQLRAMFVVFICMGRTLLVCDVCVCAWLISSWQIFTICTRVIFFSFIKFMTDCNRLPYARFFSRQAT